MKDMIIKDLEDYVKVMRQEFLDLFEQNEVLEDRIEKFRQELAEAYKEGYREGFLAAREQQHTRFK
jgi:flagellar biosynthesis/type III secretory pathway protein FliH